jgi:hypothetical protein
MPKSVRLTVIAALVIAVLAAISPAKASAQSEPLLPPLNRQVYIDHLQTGLQLVPNDFITTADTEVQAYPLIGNETRERSYRWTITEAPGGDGYRIRNVGSGRCLTADQTTRLALVYQRECLDEDDGQRWGFDSSNVAGGYTIFPVVNSTVSLSPDAPPWVWPGGDWATRLHTYGPYQNQWWRARTIPRS